LNILLFSKMKNERTSTLRSYRHKCSVTDFLFNK
jgi:hypothetical protein